MDVQVHGDVARMQDNYARAVPLLEESLRMFQAMDDQVNIAWPLSALGWIAHQQGDHERGRSSSRV
jgi:hypothetical protein